MARPPTLRPVSIEPPPAPPAYRSARTHGAGPRGVPPRLERLSRRHPLVIAAVIVAVTVDPRPLRSSRSSPSSASQWWIFDIVTSYRPQFVLVLTLAVVVLAALALLAHPGRRRGGARR